MQRIRTAELRCKYCNSTDVVKAGKRRLKCGIKQLYKCNGCLRKFSNLHRNQKQTDPEVILKTLILVCRGYSYDQASRFVLRKYQTLISTSVISKWVKEYNPPYLRRMLKDGWPPKSAEIAKFNPSNCRAGTVADLPAAAGRFSTMPALQIKDYPPEQTVISHVFTHRDLNYNFQVHRPKLDRVSLPNLKSFLLKLPQVIRHEDFAASEAQIISEGNRAQPGSTAARCSQLKTDLDIAVKQSKYTQACKDALKAMQFAKSNRQRHDVVENFMLNCDCYTIAAEVPVWVNVDAVSSPLSISCSERGEDTASTLIAGHIDLLQWKFNTLYILDFKPNAAKEQKRKVATQLNLYALALAKLANLSLAEIRCAWFDEEDFFSFKPKL